MPGRDTGSRLRPSRAACGLRQERRRRLLEGRIAVPHIGLEVGTLGPLIPGVDEHELPLGRLLPLHLLDGAPQPAAVELRRGVDPGRGPLHPPGRIVPTGHHATVERVVGRRPGERVAKRLAVVEHSAAEAAVHPAEPRIPEVGGRNLERWKLDRRVEAKAPRIGLVEGVHCGQMQARQALALGEPPPAVGAGRWVGEQPRPVDGQERLTLDRDIPRIAEGWQQVAQKPLVAVGRVTLLQEHLAVEAVPGPRPVLVGPAETEGKVRLAAGQKSFNRLLEDPPAVKPVVVKAEPVDPVTAGHLGLPFEHGRVGEVVIANVWMRHVRLLMAGEHRPGPADIGPFGEALTPPGIVFRHAVKLRQVHRDRPHVAAVGRAGHDRRRGRACHRPGAGRIGGRAGRPGPSIGSSRLVFGNQEVDKRIDVGSKRRGPGRHVGGEREVGRRLPPLPPAAAEKVRQGLEPGQRHVRVAVEVPANVEERMGSPALPPAHCEVVRQGLKPGRRNVGMGREVAGRIKRRVGRAALPPAGREVVAERLLARNRDVGVADGVPRRIEERMRLAALPPAVHHVVRERVEPGGPHVGVTVEIPGRIEERAGRVPLSPAAAAVVGPRSPADAQSAGAVAGGIPAGIEIGPQVGVLRIRHASGSLERRTCGQLRRPGTNCSREIPRHPVCGQGRGRPR